MNIKKLSRVFISLCLMLSFVYSCSSSDSGSQKTAAKKDIFTGANFDLLTPTSDYVFYYDLATMPSLYIAISMLTHDKESYVYQGRETINPSKVPSHVNMLDNNEAMQEKIKELHAANPDATYTFYVLDYQFARVATFFYSAGISRDNVDVVLLNDGTETYVHWHTLFNVDTGLDTYNEYKDTVEELFSELYANPDVDPWDFYFGCYHVAVLDNDNFYFWTQWPQLLTTGNMDKDLKKIVDNNIHRYFQVNPQEYYHYLSEENQNKFLELLGLDKKWSSADETNGDLENQTIGEALAASDKPNIIITGTRTLDQQYIEDTIAYFGDEYDYFFKAHPKYPTFPESELVTMLPYALPMEAILWAFGDDVAAIGGYQSSLYMNAPLESKKFFYGIDNGEDMVEPLNLMYQEGLLGDDVKFFVLEN